MYGNRGSYNRVLWFQLWVLSVYLFYIKYVFGTCWKLNYFLFIQWTCIFLSFQLPFFDEIKPILGLILVLFILQQIERVGSFRLVVQRNFLKLANSIQYIRIVHFLPMSDILGEFVAFLFLNTSEFKKWRVLIVLHPREFVVSGRKLEIWNNVRNFQFSDCLYINIALYSALYIG